MLIKKNDLLANKELNISSTSEIENKDLEQISGFINLNSLEVKVNAKYVPGMDLAVVRFEIKGNLKIQSTRSLIPVDIDISDSDELTYTFSDYKELEDDSIIKIQDGKIELHDQIVSLIVTSIPIKIIAKDEPESFGNDKWEVISEDQYQKRKEESIDPRLAKLKDLDI